MTRHAPPPKAVFIFPLTAKTTRLQAGFPFDWNDGGVPGPRDKKLRKKNGAGWLAEISVSTFSRVATNPKTHASGRIRANSGFNENFRTAF